VRRCSGALLVVLALAGCASSSEPEAAPAPLQREITALVEQMARLHPDVDHEVPLADLHAEAAELAERAPRISRDELVVGLLRLTTLGERDGHGGIFLHDPAHTKPFTFFPLRVHDFRDGVHVVADAAGGAHVGKRVTAIDGTPLDQVVEAVKPLIPRDNASTIRLLLPEYLTCAEVLRGLGIVEGGATYSFADGSEVTLQAGHGPLGTAFTPLPRQGRSLLYRRLEQPFLLAPLERGRSLYLGYHQVASPPQSLVDRILRAARKPGFRRLVIDVRYNGGGDNTTYWPLLDLINARPLGGKVVVLMGRMTFSAAGNFVAAVDHRTKARLVGEPSGGAPNQWGDRNPIVLPTVGLTAYVAAVYVEVVPGDKRGTVRPDALVEPTVADFLAGRDPVLRRALALR
jgi:hypothetical protein